MALHFTAEELAARRKAAGDELADRALDGLLVFRQESMYYLTGYDTFGYVFFQCLYMGADGETLTLLTRTPDVRQAEHTSVIEDIRGWYDAEGADPAPALKGGLEDAGGGGPPGLVRRRGGGSGPGSQGGPRRARVRGQTPGDRDRRLRPHRLQPQARGGCA